MIEKLEVEETEDDNDECEEWERCLFIIIQLFGIIFISRNFSLLRNSCLL